jgi:RNA polymerase sigma factor (sigma-70 family)
VALPSNDHGRLVPPTREMPLTRLLAEQHVPLKQYFLRRTAHAWDAQDLVQEVWLRLLAADRDGADDIRNPEAYLYTVAANLLKKHAVRQRSAPIGSDALEQVIERLATPCDAAAGVDRLLRRKRLAELVGRLSPKCRAVLVLHYRDELSYAEIADQLGISSHMVKKYVVKALAACRQGMQRYG